MPYRTLLISFRLVLLSLIVYSPAYSQVQSYEVLDTTWRGEEIQYLGGQISVKFKDEINQQNLSRILEEINGTIADQFDEIRWVVIDLPAEMHE